MFISCPRRQETQGMFISCPRRQETNQRNAAQGGEVLQNSARRLMIKKASSCRVFCNPLPLKDPSLLCSPAASVGEAYFKLFFYNNKWNWSKRWSKETRIYRLRSELFVQLSKWKSFCFLSFKVRFTLQHICFSSHKDIRGRLSGENPFDPLTKEDKKSLQREACLSAALCDTIKKNINYSKQ